MNPSRVRVKMCGMTRSEDVAHAIHLGVDAIGLVFYTTSSRYISIDKAKAILADIPPFVDVVAVLVNPEPTFVYQLINELPIQLLQFHGDESPTFCQQFHKPYIKAVQPRNTAQIQEAIEKFEQARAILLDSPNDIYRGGSGTTFDWQIIPPDLAKSYILAGGLNQSNVAAAIKACKPYAVDVCSGIELLPGVKDEQKMSEFIKAVWSA